MFYSFKELKKLANLPKDLSVEKLSEAITSIGFEVEGYEKFTDVSGIKFAKVLKVDKNPNSEKLSVATLEFTDTQRVIQTTATNVKEGMIVIAFVPGATIGDITLDSKEMAGIVSEGMLSAPSEFGIDKDLMRPEVIAGITDYSQEVSDISVDPIEYLELDDYIIEVDILSNRSDAASYYVMARELAAKFNTELNVPEAKPGTFDSELKVTNGDAKSLAFMEADVEVISVKEQVFLAKHNIKSVNDAADLSNLTLVYAGQPTHAYDKAHGLDNFTVGRSSDTVKVFGDKEVKLENDQVILANDKVASVACVIGIEELATSSDSKTIYLELGIFDIKGVREAVKRVKLNTLASSQGSKILSKGTTELAITYLSNRLKNFSNVVNFEKANPVEVPYDVSKVSMLAGFDITKEPKFDEAIKSLEALGYVFGDKKVTVPSYRHDIETMSDMNEEIFRFYGYDNFKAKAPNLHALKVKNTKVFDTRARVMASGYQEVKTYSLISEDKNVFNPFEFKDSVKLETFVSKEREVIRDSQTYSLLEVAEFNIKRGMKDLAIFSMGMINDKYRSIAGLSTVKDYYKVQQEIVNLVGEVTFERMANDSYHPGVSAKVLKNGKMIGFIGKAHPTLTKVDAFVWELLMPFATKDASFKEYEEAPLKFEDINIEGNEDIASKIEELSKDAFEVKVIDEYVSPEGERKVTVRVVK